ncbi:MAG: STT3 domain-containing protein, partial [Promethearchaeota archaeon]
MTNKFKQYFSDLGDKIKTSVRIGKDVPFFYISLIIIVILAILVRMSPVANGVFMIKAFDSYYQFDSFTKLTQMGLHNWLNFHDFHFWYPEGVDRFNLRPGLLVSTAIVYWVLNGLGIPVTHFQVAFYFPALMGGLTVLVMYFLGKEILDRRAGLLSAFFLAFSPGHMQRTVCGFFDNETVGVFAVLLSFYFFIRAVKYGKLSDGILAGLSIGYLALSWGGLTYVFGLLPVLVVILILTKKYNARVLMAYSSSVGIGLLIYSINTTFSWGSNFDDFEVILPLITLVFLIGFHFLYIQKNKKIYNTVLRIIKISSIPIALALVIIIWQAPQILPWNLGGRLLSILNPNIRESFHLVASVGEHAPSPWSVFYFNSMIPILLVIPGIYFALRRANAEDFLMVILVITLFYFTGSMIRIILLLAPALALIGAYGLSNILKQIGTLMKKEKQITRRRKKQIKRVLGKPEGLVVYVLVAVLLFTQANHAIDVSATQLPYSDIAPMNSFHDWEETFTWMKSNLDSSTVVASWWDYGYWLTTNGNVTTVNDNGTFNQTRIGEVGMAMMQTNERYSAQIFNDLHADYVLVFFGHLIGGIGGDEGKWPWMLRICNDNTKNYEALNDIPKDNWYGDNNQVNTVFDENEYINSTDGKYKEKWFDSTLTKLMFANEPSQSTTLPSNAPNTMNYLVQQLEGTDSVKARTDAQGNLWTTHDSINGNYQLQYFEPIFYSMNRLVKVYKVNYDALNSSMKIQDASLDTNGYGSVKITNTGDQDIQISSIQISDKTITGNVNYTLQNQADPIVKAGETRNVWFNANDLKNDWEITQTYNVIVDADVNGFSIENSSIDAQVIAATTPNIRIDRELSQMKLDGSSTNAQISIHNNGDNLVKITKISINGENINSTVLAENLKNKNFLITPGTSETFYLDDTQTSYSNEFNSDVNVSVYTIDGGVAETSLAYHIGDYNINIMPSQLVNLPEDNYLFNYNTYTSYASNSGNYYMDFNSNSYLLENGTLQMRVENTGDDVISLQQIYADGEAINSFDVVKDHDYPALFDYIVDPGDYRIVRAQISNVELNSPVKIFMTAMHDTLVASDSAYFVPFNSTQSVSILSGANSETCLFTNETLRLVVKNTGFESVTLENVTLNGTESIQLNSDMVLDGSLTLAPNEIALLQVPFYQLSVNLTDTLNTEISVLNNVYAGDNVNLTAILPLNTSITRFEFDSDKYSHNENSISEAYVDLIHLMVSVDNGESVTLDGIYYKISVDGDYQYISWTDIFLYNNTLTENADPLGSHVLEGAES